ncbi:porphobilinogen synthase [Rhodoflexus sp.]
MLHRPRRNRKSEPVRRMVQETRVEVDNLIYPIFLTAGNGVQAPIKSMPGIFRLSPDEALREIETCLALGLKVFAPFPHIEDSLKDKFASESWREENLYLHSIRLIKERFPEAVLVTDVAMDPYSSDGHDGLVENGEILNDPTLEILAKMAVAQAQAGADILGPSDMMDGRVQFIREALDARHFTSVSIMSYTAKYASAFYGPFRDALDSAPRSGDKKTYQMDPANAREALLEATLDASEGADFLMVKPALAYLDIVRQLKDNFDLPIAAYNVSGEYAMIKAAAANGWIDGERAMKECLLSIRRAGATAILTYFAKEFAQMQARTK